MNRENAIAIGIIGGVILWLLVLGGIAYGVVLLASWNLAVGILVGIVVFLYVVWKVVDIHTVQVPNTPLTILLVTWWGDWDDPPVVKKWGWRFIVPYPPILYTGIPVNVSIRELDLEIRIFLLGGAEVTLPLQISWQPNYNNPGDVRDFHVYTSDAEFGMGKKDPRGEKIQSYLQEMLEEKVRSLVRDLKLWNFDQLLVMHNEIAKRVKDAISLKISGLSIGITARRVNLGTPIPSPKLKKDLERKARRKIQRRHQLIEQETIAELVNIVATQNHIDPVDAHILVMMARNKNPAGFAEVMRAKTYGNIIDRAVPTVVAFIQALRGENEPKP